MFSITHMHGIAMHLRYKSSPEKGTSLTCRLMSRCIWASLSPALDSPFLRHLIARVSGSRASSSALRAGFPASPALPLRKVACRGETVSC